MSNLRWYIQTLSVPTSDSNTSLLVNFEHAKFLFECPESTSRVFIQNRVSGKKVAHIFLSKLDQDASGGLFGALLGLRENGVKHVDIYGPPGVDHYLACGRYFTRRDNFTVHCHPVLDSTEPVLRSGSLTVYGFPLANLSPPPSPKRTSSGQRKRKRVDSNDSKKDQTSPAAPRSPSPPPSASASSSSGSDWCSRVIADMFRVPGYKKPAPPSSPSSSSRVPHVSPAWDYRPLPQPASPGSSVAWLGVGPHIRGKFLVQKAKEMGVSPGKDFGLLAKGQSVMVGDKEIKPEDCMEAGQDPSAFMLVRAGKGQIPALLQAAPAIDAAVKQEKTSLKAIYHLVDSDTLSDPAYQQWMASHPGVQNYVANPALCSDHITFTPAMLLQLRLSRLDPEVFAVPKYHLQPSAALDSDPSPSTIEPLNADINVSGTSSAAPPPSLSRRTFPYELGSAEALREEAMLKMESASPDSPAVQERMKEAWQDYLRLVEESKASIDQTPAKEAQPGDQLLVTTTGTGSATPSKYRNVSSSLVEDPDSGFSFFLDAGEGTWGQLVRRLGTAASFETLSRLSLIFISHMHGDHHAGLANLLAKRAQSGALQRLTVICPPLCKTYIHDLAAHQNLGLDKVEFVDANAVLRANAPEQPAIVQLCQNFKLQNVNTTLVDHRARCFALQVKSESGWKVVFSGDTRPCQSLVSLGKDATLLIHEATIEDSMPQVARSKGHSTFGEALKVAKDMRARSCLLTHFSQRYPKLPPLAEESPYKGDVGIAFDGMRIAVGDIWKMAHWRGALEALFRETGEPDDNSMGTLADDAIE